MPLKLSKRFYHILLVWWAFLTVWIAPFIYTGEPTWLLWPFLAVIGLVGLIGVPLMIWNIEESGK